VHKGFVHTLNLVRLVKKAHLNVRGTNFSGRHELADDAVAQAGVFVERLVRIA